MLGAKKKVLNGFEPMIRELQSHALPLGYSTISYIHCCVRFHRHKQ